MSLLTSGNVMNSGSSKVRVDGPYEVVAQLPFVLVTTRHINFVGAVLVGPAMGRTRDLTGLAAV